ncbi:MAG TPA: PD-(D/E)XK nuclease-like domain-containing protein, partial [Pseudonocardiaceae bacterium]|nr:PD-(D/E)XK nuclease-like domain-containing protein [Pseudonocardiaceae bacterium]
MTAPDELTGERWAITEPGVYEMDDADYHRDPVASGSLSSTGARRLLAPSCPAKFRWHQQHPEIKTEYDFGHAAHRAVLGIGAEIAVFGYDSWRTNAAKADKAAAREAGLVPMLEPDADVVTAMADALRAHHVAGRLFQPGRGTAERTLVWPDHATGLMRRARLDWITGGGDRKLIIADYKTCDRADPASCARSIFTYGYHAQGDWYRDGAFELGLAGALGIGFVLVFQEKTAPYVVTVVEPDDEALLWGSVLNTKAIDVYRRCVATDTWPGYSIPG